MTDRIYIAIDLKSFYASVECMVQVMLGCMILVSIVRPNGKEAICLDMLLKSISLSLVQFYILEIISEQITKWLGR